MSDIEKDLVNIVKLALAGKERDLRAYAKRVLAPIIKRRPDLAGIGSEISQQLARETDLTRRLSTTDPVPVDLDSRQELLRREVDPELPITLKWPASIAMALNDVTQEREQEEKLSEMGLTPARTLLFVGPPGVGKTLAAKWVAKKLSRPLLTLDLAAVMSSYLGKTGNNIRVVLDFAKKSPSVLLLDEFDAIAKRRDDSAEVGELKRLVTVLLQSIDDWPADGVLIAATNHPELLDPAVWRRFDRIIEFPKPTSDVRFQYVESTLNTQASAGIDLESIKILSALLSNLSFAEVKRELDQLRKQAFISKIALSKVIEIFLQEKIGHAKPQLKLQWAKALINSGISHNQVHNITGVSRDTLRKHFGSPSELSRSSKGQKEIR